MAEKWEIEFHGREECGHDCFAMVAMLTGYGMNELIERIPEKLHTRGWYGREFRQVFTSLGFDCDDRFKPVDFTTEKPCLIRFIPTKREQVRLRQAGEKYKWWDALVYYDGQVYSPDEECVYPVTLFNPAHKITSMMRVWLSAL